ncbi:MAG: metallophosphoesterase [Vicinamibacterales bacterium]
MRAFGRFLSLLVFVAALACRGESSPQADRSIPEAAARSTAEPTSQPSSAPLTGLPRKPGSLRFAVIGDAGRGDRHQYMTAAKMIEWRQWFDYAFVLMLGDNIYGDSGSPEAYAHRFERPYKALIDAGVPFYGALGNHDPIGQEHYPLFNMGGRRYYAFEKDEGSLRPLFTRKVLFVAIDTINLTRQQLKWIEGTLDESGADWKIAFYHHPLYTSGRYQLAASRFRAALEPIFIRQELDVALNGHEHFYERIVPQNGVHYFTSGAGGALRVGDLRPSGWTAAGFDTDTHFMLMEIAGDTLYFLAISRKGAIVDSGTIQQRD